MTTKPTPAWILTGGLTFSVAAGFVNAIGFLGMHHHGLSHVTGQVTQVSITLAEGNVAGAMKGVLVGVWFFVGAVLSGVIVQRAELSRKGRRYVVAMLVESALLALATWLLVRGDDHGEYVAAAACGLQNGMATSYSGAVLRTTHMTGVVTDLGILIGHWVRREPLERERFKLLVVLLGGFLTGGVLGAVAFEYTGPWALAFPAAALAASAVAFTIIRSRREAPTARPLPSA